MAIDLAQIVLQPTGQAKVIFSDTKRPRVRNDAKEKQKKKKKVMKKVKKKKKTKKKKKKKKKKETKKELESRGRLFLIFSFYFFLLLPFFPSFIHSFILSFWFNRTDESMREQSLRSARSAARCSGVSRP